MLVYTVLYVKCKHDTMTCGKLATATIESRRLFDAKSAAVREVVEVRRCSVWRRRCKSRILSSRDWRYRRIRPLDRRGLVEEKGDNDDCYRAQSHGDKPSWSTGGIPPS